MRESKKPMPAKSPLACAYCLDAVMLRVDADWVSSVMCPTCGGNALLHEAFRDAETYEADYLRGRGLKQYDGPDGRSGPPWRFITSRMLCVLRR